MSGPPANAFKPIGEAAEATDALQDIDDNDDGNIVDGDHDGIQEGTYGTEDHPVEVIESLCVQCGENVSWPSVTTMMMKKILMMLFDVASRRARRGCC